MADAKQPYRWKTDKNLHGVHFSSPLDLLQCWADDGPQVAPCNIGVYKQIWKPKMAKRFEDASWYGGAPSIEDVVEKVEDGWASGAARIDGYRNEIQDSVGELRPVAIRRVKVRGAEGDELDYDRMRRGDTDQMWTRSVRRARAKVAPVVTVMMAWGCNAFVNQEAMFWTGAVAIGVTDMLEEAGFRVALVGCDGTGLDGGRNALLTVEAKSFNEPVNAALLASTMCHVGFYRTFGFLGLLCTDTKFPTSYGRAEDFRLLVDTPEDLGYYADTSLIKVSWCRSRDEALRETSRLLEQVAVMA